MVPLLNYVRTAGAAPPAAPAPLTPLGALLAEYRSWMVGERGLAATTVARYENTARRFLQQRAVSGAAFEPAALTGVDVNAFLRSGLHRVGQRPRR